MSGLPTYLPEKREFTRPQMLRLARRWMDRTGLRLVLHEKLTSATGRRRILAPDALLMLLFMYAITHRDTFWISDVCRLADTLTNSERIQLGITEPVTYWQIDGGLDDLCRALEPDDAPEHVNKRTGEVIPRRHNLDMPIPEFLTRLVSAAIPERLPPSATVAIDGTDAPSWGRKFKTDRVTGERGESTLDCGASIGHRTATEQHSEEMFYGRMIHITVDVAEMGGLPRPALARSANIVKASGGEGDSNAPAGIATVDAHEKVVGKITHIIADRGYTQAEAKNWAMLLWIRGISQTSDLRDDQRIVETGPVKGTIWCDGWLYTNAMPEKLRHLPRLDNDNLTAEEYEELAALYEARKAYAFTMSSSLDAETLTIRVKGPALAGHVRCPNNPASMSLPYKATRPQTKRRPGVPCGCGVTAKLGPEHHARERQPYLYGTALQVASYNRRVAVESFNAELSLHRGKLQRGTTRCFMANKTELLLAIYIAAANCCIIRDYYAMHPDLADEGDESMLCHVPKVVRRRKPRKEARHRLLAAVGLAT